MHLAEMRAVAGGFWQWGQDALLDPYVEPYFASLRRWWEERSREEALDLARGLFPSTLVRPDVVEATSTALGDDSLRGPLRRILLENRDGLERALRARAADRD
jgi:aminopeptidase N